ncbi:MAG TPA: hypothetical protein VIJ41_01715 [Candidatus Nanopelagicales bacterium]
MADPGYDFFATGTGAGSTAPSVPAIPGAQPPAAAGHGAGAAPAVNQFGTPIAPAANRFGSPPPPPVRVAPGSGYAPGAVNQFGTPIDAPVAPTGPFAAPGVAAAPVAVPGMVSTWNGPGTTGRAAHAAHASASATLRRPDGVATAAVVGLVVGGLTLLMGALVLFLYLAFTTQIGVSGLDQSAGFDGLVSVIRAALLQLLVICLAFGLLYAVAGVAALKGHVWGAWTLLVLGVLTLLKAAYDLATSGLPDVNAGYLAGWVVSNGLAAVLVVMLSLPESQRWMRGR